MENVYVTVDIEEWYHLEYIKKYIDNIGTFRVISLLDKFLNELDRLEIKATFFVLGEIAEENSKILRLIASRGHEIACHGLDHELLYNKNDKQFFEQVSKAKSIIENITETEVKGYRASCYSMEDSKMEVLRKLGFAYDSSYIRFEQHDLYRKLNLEGFNKEESLIYKKDGLFEFEIPTVKLWKYNIPISGGGYIRLFPLWLIKILLGIYGKTEENFVLYIHPFELTSVDIPISKQLSFKDNFRMNIGRKRSLKKIVKLLEYFKSNGAKFSVMNDRVRKNIEKDLI